MTNNIFKQQTLSEFNLLLENNPSLNLAYTQLGNNSGFQQRFKDYMCGTKTLPLTYDPFFKKIFDVHEHPERLSNLISSMIGKKVKVKIDMLENIHIAALDIFAETAYHKIIEDIPKNKKTHLDHSTLFNDLNMWLSLLCTETIENAEKLIQIFPTLKEVFMDMQEYTTKPSEAINMFSEALKILDINTVNYMVDDMKAEIEAQKTELSIKNNIINELKNKTDKQDTIIDNQNHTINSLKSTINDINTTLENLKQELFQLKNKENGHKT